MKRYVKTTYGEIVVTEDEMGAVTITFNTDEDVMVEMKASNSLKFHLVEPRSNRIISKENLANIDFIVRGFKD